MTEVDLCTVGTEKTRPYRLLQGSDQAIVPDRTEINISDRTDRTEDRTGSDQAIVPTVPTVHDLAHKPYPSSPPGRRSGDSVRMGRGRDFRTRAKGLFMIENGGR